jgi:hypothetical protein
VSALEVKPPTFDVPRVSFEHINRMSDHRGLFEHAAGTVRRLEHGYCTDDNARLLVVTAREPDHGSARHLSRLALRFVLDSLAPDGRVHNRMAPTGEWTDHASTDDCWGRAVWGLGVAVRFHDDPFVRAQAQQGLEKAIQQRSVSRRAMAFAVLGAADLLESQPDHQAARALLADAITVIGGPLTKQWRWPEPRLAYANAAIAEAVIASGAALHDNVARTRGLEMLGWLLDLETPNGHLSVAGVDGRGPDDVGPRFDQQPIEAAAMADACWRAYRVTGDGAWLRGVEVSADWFRGKNDAGLTMFDGVSGGGFDGLQPTAVNLNQGAESTLAYLSTMQRASMFAFSA